MDNNPQIQQPVPPQPTASQNIPQTSNGFPKTALLIGGLVILFLALAGCAYYLGTKKNNSQPITISSSNSTATLSPSAILTSSPSPTNDPTTGWKTYTSTTSKISFRYPSDWIIQTLNSDTISVFNEDSNGKGRFEVNLEVGNVPGDGAGGTTAFKVHDHFLINAQNAYILGDDTNAESLSSYDLSACDAPKKCLFNVPSTNLKIDFYAVHYNSGDQAVMPFPVGDPRTEIAYEILKTIKF